MSDLDLPAYLSQLTQLAGLLERVSQNERESDRLDSVLAEGEAYIQDALWTNTPSPLKAQISNGLGQAYYAHFQATGIVNDINRSIELFEQTLELVASTQRRRASVLSNLSAALQLRHNQWGNPIDMERAVETALMATELVPADSPEIPSYLINLTGALYERYMAQGQVDDLNSAIYANERAIASTPAKSLLLLQRKSNLATLYHERYSRIGELNDLRKAADTHREVLANTSEERSNFPVYLNNLGGCLLDLYRRTKTMDDLLQAIEVLRKASKTGSSKSPHQPGFLNNLGNALSAHFQKTGDLKSLEEAIRVQREAEEMLPGSPLQASFLTSLGSSLLEYYLRTHDRVAMDEAIDVCKKALEQTSSGSPKLASRWNNLARGFMERYKLLGSATDLENGQVAYQRTCEEGLALQTEVALLAGYNWGEWALQRGAWAEAIQALEYATAASKALFQRQFLRVEKEDWLRDAQILPGMIAYANSRMGNYLRAILALETGRTRIIAEMLNLQNSKIEQLSDGEFKPLYDRYRQVISRAAEVELVAAGESSYSEAVREVRQELSLIVDELKAIPGFEDMFQDPAAIDIPELLTKSGLDAIVYIVVTSVGGMGLLAGKENIEPVWFNVNSIELDRVMLGEKGDPEMGYLGAILGFTSPKDILDRVCAWLDDRLVMPILEHLELNVIKKICVIPTGSIALLPLNAGWYSAGGVSRDRSKSLAVSYAPSLILLEHSMNIFTGLSKVASLLGIADPTPLENMPILEFATAEVEAISKSLPSSAIILDGEKASIENVVALLPTATYVHFACHAVFDPLNPYESGLILSQGKRLRVRDILGRLSFSKTRLIVLSSCQTAVIDFAKIPEEAVGLPASFLHAGIPGVISTLWPVNDLSTALLMIRFYQLHLDGEKPEQSEPLEPILALQKAQLWLQRLTKEQIDEFVQKHLPELTGRANLRKDATFDHPYYWAGFTLNGL